MLFNVKSIYQTNNDFHARINFAQIREENPFGTLKFLKSIEDPAIRIAAIIAVENETKDCFQLKIKKLVITTIIISKLLYGAKTESFSSL